MDPGALTPAYRRDRRRLVERLRAAGIEDLAILHAFDTVPRHHFVPEAVRHRAYQDVALPLGFGQSISRPTVHAFHLSLAELQGEEEVLEIGTGSGFQTALLAALARRVHSVEVIPELAEMARRLLTELGVGNVEIRTGDGSRGWPEAAPFDVILVGAAVPAIPRELRAQLADGGRMVIPVGEAEHGQELRRLRRRDGEWEEEVIDSARFIPLLRGGV
ncbi:MAG: protein-L-isoaspartate(D-aspartate) O-methyltransferase [Gemmatimonadota bacterium]